MKKVFWTLVTILLLLTVFCLAASAEDVYRGEEFSLTIQIDEYEEIKTGSIEFLYNKDAFEITEGEWTLVPEPFMADFKNGDGRGVYIYASPVTLGGDVFKVTFRVKDTAAFAEEEVSVKVRLMNANSESEWVEYVLGNYNVLCRHSFAEQVTSDTYRVQHADCTTPETFYYSCACGEKGTETFTVGEALGHVYDHGCDTTCNVCGFFRENAHSYNTEYRKDGHTHWQICTICGDQSTPVPHVSASPCDAVCSVCGGTKPVTHEYESQVVAPTCTSEGYTKHTCVHCGNSYTDSRTNKLDHTPGAAANCLNDQTCTVCGTVLNGKLGHSYTSTVKAPTCTEGGYTTKTCTRCSHSVRENETPAKGHTPGAAADCVNDQTCTECGVVVAGKLDHSYESTVTDPTCTEEGYTTKTCTRCGDTLRENQTAATGHTPGEWTVVKEAAIGEAGEKQKACVHCHEVLETETIPALEEETTVESESQSETVTDPETDPENESGSSVETDPEQESKDNETEKDPQGEKNVMDKIADFIGISSQQVVTIGAIIIGAILLIAIIAFVIHKLRYL